MLDIPLFCIVLLSALVVISTIVIPISGFCLLAPPVLGLVIRKIGFKDIYIG